MPTIASQTGGMTTFDIASATAPVIVLHGDEDAIVDPMQARHAVDSAPGAQLRIIDGLGTSAP